MEDSSSLKMAPKEEEEEEPVYQETNSLVVSKKAIQEINEKYDSVGQNKRVKHVEITDHDLMQIEMFFQSHKTSVYVCPSLVNVYLSGPLASEEAPTWQLTNTGILVLIHDSGETRARTRRQIRLIIAEQGTGFVLWEDIIDNLSNYTAPNVTFHTMYLSKDHRCMVGFSFDDALAAKELQIKVEKLTSDPANISLSGPSTKNRKSKKKAKAEKIKLPKKADISLPCCFQHVTKVDPGDKTHLYSLSTLTGGGEDDKSTL